MAAIGWTVKQGVVLTRTHAEQTMMRLVEAMVDSAVERQLPGGLVVITSGWRPEAERFSLHPWSLALDFRINNLIVGRGQAREDAGWEWVARARRKLDDRRYQFMVHGGEVNPANIHIHGEWDPRY